MTARAMRIMGLLLLAGGLIVATGCRKSPAPPCVTINGRTWYVEVAATAQQRYQGLSGRTDLGEDSGMLFVFPQPQVLNFCMRGCLIPLDIAFIGADFRVMAIHTMAVEPDRLGKVPYSSGVRAQFALEVPAGALGRAGVKVGDKVLFAGNIPEAAKAQGGP